MKYQRRSVPVEAFQFFKEKKPWPYEVRMHAWETGPGDTVKELPSVEIEFPGRWSWLKEGDWVVTIDRGLHRRVEVMDDKRFKEKFELVPEP